ncbi:hypothetical protein [Cellulomonas bogoriensis]|uniref:Uncharacterized protein n=1 Tax=Cellulomonas bogoriensis 69B4 = DSM 16987 TaxID=1386082 RepID=A0A0A0BSG8_9CELL|nr:hypothetical protein [Cellulomonas bogoriensis]KGM10607.1 hypothetical protein N869_04430 [Cellulomonas bogoriensis 69B4 = DSM 16987]
MAPTVDVNGTIFKYAELRTGHRGIKIWTEGADPVEYRIDPDPHQDREYNKNQARFYAELAKEIGTLYLAANPNAFPPFGTQVTVPLTGTEYTLNQP